MGSNRIQINSHGMSNIAASYASSNNELERWKLMNELLHINTEENHKKVQNLREVQQIKDELLHLVATAYVFRYHQFSKYDPYGKLKEDDEPNEVNKRSLELNAFPGLPTSKSPTRGKRRQSVSGVENLKPDADTEGLDAYMQRPMSYRHSLPNIHHICGAELAEGIPKKETTLTEEDADIFPQIYPQSGLGKMAIWCQNKEVMKKDSSPMKQRYRKKVEQAKIKDEFLKMYPGNCRTSYTMRNFIKRETSAMIKNSDSILYSKKNKELGQLKKHARLPDIIQRNKTTSAIFREFRGYKSKK